MLVKSLPFLVDIVSKRQRVLDLQQLDMKASKQWCILVWGAGKARSSGGNEGTKPYLHMVRLA